MDKPRHWHLLPIIQETWMVTRNVVLTEAQSELVERLVASGRYQNASEALRAGLRLLEREESELAVLRERLLAGLEQAGRGELADGTGAEAIRRAFGAARARRT
jgi:antitoxin ParD1/3/4